jgi:hypothetical protein
VKPDVHQLPQPAAVALAGSLAAFVASQAGIRLLIVKGPVLAEQGLRAPRWYADVDVWVAPADVQAFVQLLTDRGWHERGPSWFLERVGTHSVTLINDNWPCDIDVHMRFPGLFADDDVIFEELWRTRGRMQLAGRDVEVTGRPASAVILALHSIRQIWDPSRLSELEGLVERARGDDELIEGIRDFAAVAGANETLAQFFERLGTRPKAGHVARTAQLRTWNNRRAHHSRTGLWIDYLTRVPKRRWPHELAMVLWPPADLYLQDHPDARVTGPALFSGRLRRLVKGASGLVRIGLARMLGR